MMAVSTVKGNAKGDKQAGDNHKSRQYEGAHLTNPWLFSGMIGFFAGLIWGVMRWLFYEMKFTTELPGFLADPFFKSAYLKTGWGIVVGIASYIVFSVLAALLYQALLSKLKGPWPGVLYGLAWWVILFVLLGPVTGMSQRITAAGWNTLFSELCLFLLWGIFIGYSIAFEFTDEASREPLGAH
ncbi:YqhR family membrane protein [Paenibacillus glycanilyticus]|uniref:YqhR family membrane protein n=1 Tax=Paenibacillus glycanilyticus TaxID=126569 RepID=UPI0020413C0C|nr:YqhR family membrane protein [Paenibacillus glycanilyticus]MCM3627331.1 YqhR family membrane protein [Paenibacillus glycanilyticus]